MDLPSEFWGDAHHSLAHLSRKCLVCGRLPCLDLPTRHFRSSCCEAFFPGVCPFLLLWHFMDLSRQRLRNAPYMVWVPCVARTSCQERAISIGGSRTRS